jgi:hypothetical protein
MKQIANIKVSLNKGISPETEQAEQAERFVLSKFPIIHPVKRESIETINISDPY